VDRGLLISHKTIHENLTGSDDWFQTLEPEKIDFISYPYEWCFDMLKDAALVTLQAAQEAMKFGMMLKDASSYNVQWHKGKMIFIDTLSFEKYDEAKPWIAYRQFCEHFLAPLALMHYLKLPLQNLLLAYPDGIPLTIVKKLLPAKSKFNLNSFLHLHLHASISARPAQKQKTVKPFSKTKLKNLLKSLEETVQSFSFHTASGVWSGYYDEAFQRENYVAQKKKIVEKWISDLPIKTTIDIGANEGEFSELLAQNNIDTISADFDHYSINRLYNRVKQKTIFNVLPLVIDFTNPSPAIGVNNEERSSFFERTKTDMVLALALIHHLAIGKNIPFDSIAKMFSKLGNYLIIEFVPKPDEKIQLMLQQKKDVYFDYTEEKFLRAFEFLFSLIKTQEVGNSGRTLYLFKSHA
jgi:2-polyprenyl-3-methyl-5-hydroxy-6-metoxy-1,4-benzoquinol methylase